MKNELKQKLVKIKLIISDVDGVLTDGSIYKGNDGMEFKKFSIEDGAGIALAKSIDLKIAILSGRFSPATETRVRELNIDDVYNGVLNKIPPYEELKRKYDLDDSEIAYVGDDLIDLPVMEKVGVPVAVRNAYQPVKDIALYTTKLRGGEGALRETIEWILQGQGRYEEAIELMKKRLKELVN